jgi:formamidopyrimidine-DNA glycosylase
MPELPEVETVRRGLQPVLEGAMFVHVEQRRPDLRFALPDRFAERLTGRRVAGLERRAKYLLIGLDGDETLLVHLGMTGRFVIERADERRHTAAFHHAHGRLCAHDHLILITDAGCRIVYNDVRRFGFMDLLPSVTRHETPHLAGLGVEPLGNALDGQQILSLFAGRAAPIKAALLDQRLIAGLGNIYVCEALHRAGVSPYRSAGMLSQDEAARLASEIRATLEEALEAGGSTLRDFHHADGSLGYFQHRFKVYDRAGEACARAGCCGTIERQVQSGRSSFFCATCQT